MKAVIMAGGEGSRLRPLTTNLPKPMIPLANRPMMEHVVNLLRQHGFDEIVVTVAYLANAIRTYFGDGSEFGVRMVYATEETPLGTAGSVRNAMDELTERFLVISGDVLTDIDLSAIASAHTERGALATIGLTPVDNPLEFGIVITRDDGSIERFLEKPSWGQVFSDTINTGIFMLEPEIFDYIPAGRPVDFSAEVFPKLLQEARPLYGAVAQGYWEDVGTLDAYVRAHRDILDGLVRVDMPGFDIGNGVWMGDGAAVHPDAVVDGPAIIGDNCKIMAGAHIGNYTVLGQNVRVRGGADVERTVVHDNAYIGESTRLRGTVVGRACDLRRGVRTDEGAVLGDECFVAEDAFIGTDVKIYPFKTVEAGAVINSSIVWESKGARSLFGRDGVAGLANVDVTPELAVRLAMAYASTLRADATVITSRDSSRSARMLKRAIMAGLNSGGVNVVDLEVGSVPVTRFLIRQRAAAGGVSVRIKDGDPQSVIIRFFDANGADLGDEDQRRIERLFHREDFRRVLPAEIGDIDYPPRALESYATGLNLTIDPAAIRAAKFKVVIDYSYGTAALVMPNVLAKLGADVLAVNPYTSTIGVIDHDPARQAVQVAALVRTGAANLGAVIDPDGEHVTFIDDSGHVLTHSEALLAMVHLVTGHMLGDRVALPVGVSSAAEQLASANGKQVEYTKMSTPALAGAAGAPGVGFAAGFDGGYIIPGFLPAFDGAAALVKMMDLLAHHETTLSQVVEVLPRLAFVHETVVTPWDQKGAVMRSLMEQTARPTVLVDGVKVLHDNGAWVLALPDPEDAVTHVYAEAATEADVRRLANEYVLRIRQLVR
ncbi:MAG: sugar phosphate nucleotidyltransferase [Acidimicrobiia bacterium]|nr:sugar phosphate nucleotidyltransferase [Acidimicrobiia bacterium]